MFYRDVDIEPSPVRRLQVERVSKAKPFANIIFGDWLRVRIHTSTAFFRVGQVLYSIP